MKSLFEELKDYKIEKSNKTERGELTLDFMNEINKERTGKYKPLNYKRIAKCLEGLKTEDLYPFLSKCRDYKKRSGSFGKCFFGSLKIK